MRSAVCFVRNSILSKHHLAKLFRCLRLSSLRTRWYQLLANQSPIERINASLDKRSGLPAMHVASKNSGAMLTLTSPNRARDCVVLNPRRKNQVGEECANNQSGPTSNSPSTSTQTWWTTSTSVAAQDALFAENTNTPSHQIIGFSTSTFSNTTLELLQLGNYYRPTPLASAFKNNRRHRSRR